MDQLHDIGAQHAHLLRLLQQERLALLAGEIAQARDLLTIMQALQETHIADEESRLLPRLPQTARWPARIYIAEHRKLVSMLADLCAALAPLAARVEDGATRITLLDAQMPFKHVLEHHFEREEKGLLAEILT
jgi:hemerythrin-like domain-containing protein